MVAHSHKNLVRLLSFWSLLALCISFCDLLLHAQLSNKYKNNYVVLTLPTLTVLNFYKHLKYMYILHYALNYFTYLFINHFYYCGTPLHSHVHKIAFTFFSDTDGITQYNIFTGCETNKRWKFIVVSYAMSKTMTFLIAISMCVFTMRESAESDVSKWVFSIFSLLEWNESADQTERHSGTGYSVLIYATQMCNNIVWIPRWWLMNTTTEINIFFL